MNDVKPGPVHWSFWAISAIALAWNFMGLINFYLQMDPNVLANYRESERAIVEGRPLWATVAFAIAVFGGTIGCLLLLFRKSAAYYLLVASLLGVIVTMIHTFSVGIDFSAGEIMGIILMPIVVAVLLIWFSRQAERKGWIS
ncbi:MAG: hypothetical protein HOD92_24265 [Deltaproteobacteria bacterium]|jgi:hypothetical protein|nr:hypothetical protein [Deltaproteobacteria bacterium]